MIVSDRIFLLALVFPRRIVGSVFVGNFRIGQFIALAVCGGGGWFVCGWVWAFHAWMFLLKCFCGEFDPGSG